MQGGDYSVDDSDYTYLLLICPLCGCPDIVARKADVDEYGEFVDDPKVSCLRCGHECRVSEMGRQEWTNGGIH